MEIEKRYKKRRSDIWVNRNDPAEIAFFQKKYPHKTQQQIKDAIKAAGPLRKDIESYLLTGNTGW